MTFTRVAAVEDLWSGELQGFVVDGRKVLLIRSGEVVTAYEDRCAHLGVPLSKGRLEGDVLTCSAHEWQYDIRSGRGINPATACLKAYPVKIDQGQVWVDANG